MSPVRDRADRGTCCAWPAAWRVSASTGLGSIRCPERRLRSSATRCPRNATPISPLFHSCSRPCWELRRTNEYKYKKERENIIRDILERTFIFIEATLRWIDQVDRPMRRSFSRMTWKVTSGNMRRSRRIYRCFGVSAACQRIDPRRSRVTNGDHRPILYNVRVTAASMRGNAIFGQPRSPLGRTDSWRRNSPLPRFSGFLIRRSPPRIASPANRLKLIIIK